MDGCLGVKMKEQSLINKYINYPFTCLKRNKSTKYEKKWLELLVEKSQDLVEAGHNGTGINIKSIAKEMLSRGISSTKVNHLKNCVRYSTTYVCENCGNKEYLMCRCKNRLCPLCFGIRYSKIKNKYYKGIKSMRYPKLLTVTVGRISKLDGSEISFYRLKLKALIRKFYKKIFGGFIVTEITPQFYLHFHAIIDTKTRISHSGITAAWKVLTGRYIIDIRMIRSPKRALNYVIKYVCKIPHFNSVKDYVDYYQMTQNKRLISAFGDLRKFVKKQEKHSLTLKCSECGYEVTFVRAWCLVDHDWMVNNQEWWRDNIPIQTEVKQ